MWPANQLAVESNGWAGKVTVVIAHEAAHAPATDALTEIETGALAIAALMLAGHTGEVSVDELAAATGVSILRIRRAVRLLRRDPAAYSPSDRVALCAEPTSVATSADAETRTCPECGQLKAVSAFPIRTDTHGTRRAWCGACLLELSRVRYVSVDVSQRFGTLIRFVVHRLDACAGDTCTECRDEILVGDEVEALDLEFRHVDCASGT